MKTCLYSLSYLDGLDNTGSSRLERQIKYVKYYSKLKEILGFEWIEFCENNSSKENINNFIYAVSDQPGDIAFYSFPAHIPRGKDYDMGYVWRGLHYIRELIEDGYEKIICIDSDGFVLTKRLADYIRNCNSGWVSLFNNYYNFPTAEMHILNKDKFEFFMGYTSTDWRVLNGQCQEKVLPFSDIERNFNTLRIGEYPTTDVKYDFISQVPVSMKVELEK